MPCRCWNGMHSSALPVRAAATAAAGGRISCCPAMICGVLLLGCVCRRRSWQEISRAGEVHYFLQPTGCGGQVIEARVQDYLARYDVPAREAIDVRWAQTCMALEDTVEQLETVLSPVLVRRMQAKLWQALYFGYDYTQDYLPQLEANLQTLDTELRKLTEYQKKRNNRSK